MRLEGAGSYAPAGIQAQHGLCPIAERTFENSGQLERVKSRYYAAVILPDEIISGRMRQSRETCKTDQFWLGSP